jgi:hypothetical protein
LLRKLEDNKYQNVGVLPFRVKNGAQPETINFPPYSRIVARSLENALVQQHEEVKSVRIIRNAVEVLAEKEKQPIFLLSADGQAGLFRHRYPLWDGGREV